MSYWGELSWGHRHLTPGPFWSSSSVWGLEATGGGQTEVNELLHMVSESISGVVILYHPHAVLRVPGASSFPLHSLTAPETSRIQIQLKQFLRKRWVTWSGGGGSPRGHRWPERDTRLPRGQRWDCQEARGRFGPQTLKKKFNGNTLLNLNHRITFVSDTPHLSL